MNNSLPPPTDAVAPPEPIRLGHYELLDCIGRGGMGLVYRARDTRLDRQVAIKCLRTELFEAHYVERFKREALLLAKLNHPNIVQIYDFIEAADQLALVMELVDGENLQVHLREHIVPITKRMQWLVQITQGLAIAHDANIIHRDLKPENILINKRGQAKITDLGIAKSQDFNATLTDHVAGSYCSMSPEQAMGEAIDFKSDLFSLGILAYQLLCGAHPFGDTSNKLQIMQRIISHPPIPPSKHNPNLAPEMVDLLGQLLSKNPENRPDNTHWVAAQFEYLSSLVTNSSELSDDTQALIPNATAANQTINTSARKSSRNTQDHPTFETRFVAMNAPRKPLLWLRIRNYLIANKISVGLGTLSVLIIASVIVWQLQPKPPKYVAVIPPKLTAAGMQESQQELVKGAVYDAIQQSVIQLDGYYLIPREEIADVDGDNETVRRATAADELITTEIQCKIDSCTINLVRLVPNSNDKTNRLRAQNLKTIDVLTYNYLSVAVIVQDNISAFYLKEIDHSFDQINESDYTTYLESNRKYQSEGATKELLEKIEKIQTQKQSNPAIQTLQKDISIDLYFESKNLTLIESLEKQINKDLKKNETIISLNNLFYLQIAKKDFQSASKTISRLKLININQSAINELHAYEMMAKNDFESAIEFYKKALNSKKTVGNLFNLANAYWHSGDTPNAKKYLEETLKLSPNQYKALGLDGLISMLDGDIEAATLSFEKTTVLRPNDTTNLNNLGITYLLSGRYLEAIIFFQQAAQIIPTDSTFKLNIADAKNLAGDTEGAAIIYQSVIDLINNGDANIESLRNRSQAYAHLGRFSEALTDLQKLEKEDPQNAETIYTSALVHSIANNKASSILSIENSLKSGMSVIWFKFTWFDKLCEEESFSALMGKMGQPNRCPIN